MAAKKRRSREARGHTLKLTEWLQCQRLKASPI
jgi:hypothetical protein